MLVSLGYNTFVESDDVVMVVNPESIDYIDGKFSSGEISICSERSCRSLVVLRDGRMIACTLAPETVVQRLGKKREALMESTDLNDKLDS